MQHPGIIAGVLCLNKEQMLELLIISLVLAVDATVYSFSYGLVLRCCRLRNSLWLALTVGLFQAGMPLLGYLGGESVREIVAQWQSGIVATVFCGLGAYIIYGAWTEDEENECCSKDCNPLGLIALLLVGIATAIDALAVGVAMALGDIGGADITLAHINLPSISLYPISCIMALTSTSKLSSLYDAYNSIISNTLSRDVFIHNLSKSVSSEYFPDSLYALGV